MWNLAQIVNSISRAGIEMFVVGIGGRVDKQELRDIASNNRHVYQVHNFDELDSIHETVANEICGSEYCKTSIYLNTAVFKLQNRIRIER